MPIGDATSASPGYGLRRRDALTLGALVVCTAALVSGLVLIAVHRGGSAPLARAPLPAAASTPIAPGPTAGAPLGPSPSVVAGTPAARNASGSVAAVRLGPSSLAIPALSVRAAIVGAPVENGVLEPPINSRQVGLWSGSAALGARAGTVTIAGHVNWAGMGTFAFARLATLRPGDVVYTTAADGTQQAWRVTSLSARTKASGIDTGAFAGASGPRRLVLITCGGTFDSGARSYLNNVYVYATPVRLLTD